MNMPIARKIIPPLGVLPRQRATLMTSAAPLPPELIEDPGVPMRWVGGLQFQSIGCDPLERATVYICGASEERIRNPLGEIVQFDSFVVYDGKTAGTICSDIERIDDDPIIRFPAFVSAQLADELMAGGARLGDEGSDPDPNINPTLQSSAIYVGGGPYRPNDALALLEQAIADTLFGAQGTLHITPRGLSTINFLDQGFASDAGVWYTSQDNLVIADAGYVGPAPDLAGTDPVEADEWWYSSGPVFWAMTEPRELGEPFEQVDPFHNTIEVIYQAYAMVLFDPCAVVAVPVCYEPECAPAV